jgi:hypothetical protein
VAMTLVVAEETSTFGGADGIAITGIAPGGGGTGELGGTGDPSFNVALGSRDEGTLEGGSDGEPEGGRGEELGGVGVVATGSLGVVDATRMGAAEGGGTMGEGGIDTTRGASILIGLTGVGGGIIDTGTGLGTTTFSSSGTSSRRVAGSASTEVG